MLFGAFSLTLCFNSESAKVCSCLSEKVLQKGEDEERKRERGRDEERKRMGRGETGERGEGYLAESDGSFDRMPIKIFCNAECPAIPTNTLIQKERGRGIAR